MGYMGFGLQKWIYTMKPRKPFKKREGRAGYDIAEESFKDVNHDPILEKRKRGQRGYTSSKQLDARINESRKRLRIDIFFEKAQNLIYIAVIIALLVFVIINIVKYSG